MFIIMAFMLIEITAADSKNEDDNYPKSALPSMNSILAGFIATKYKIFIKSLILYTIRVEC